ncbi:MAG: hypothetical protein ACI9UN_003167 [Granulosicoccus sp.]|jgi:hypothetical protein
MSKKLPGIILATALSMTFAVPSEAGPRNNRAKPHKTLKVLTKVHHRVVYRGKPYFYGGGRFYRHSDGVYLAITAPIGAIVPALPGGYVTFGIGSSRYYYNNGIYYRPTPSGYIVIKEPAEAETVLTSVGSDKLIIYPAAGQNVEQKSQDKYECYEWASLETLFDPTNPDSDPLLRVDYQRAMGACLEARQYIVK